MLVRPEVVEFRVNLVICRKGFLKISQFPAELVEEMSDPKVESVAN